MMMIQCLFKKKTFPCHQINTFYSKCSSKLIHKDKLRFKLIETKQNKLKVIIISTKQQYTSSHAPLPAPVTSARLPWKLYSVLISDLTHVTGYSCSTQTEELLRSTKISKFCIFCGMLVVVSLLMTIALATPLNFVVLLVDDLGYGDLSCYGRQVSGMRSDFS